MAAIIDFKHVNKYYGKFHALKDINLSIEEGQVCFNYWTIWFW